MFIKLIFFMETMVIVTLFIQINRDKFENKKKTIIVFYNTFALELINCYYSFSVSYIQPSKLSLIKFFK